MRRQTILIIATLVVVLFLGILSAGTFYVNVWPVVVEDRVEDNDLPPVNLNLSVGEVADAILIVPQRPFANGEVTVTANIPEASFVDVFFVGSGCGSLRNMTGKSPLVIPGTVPGNGYCHIEAQGYVSANGSERIIQTYETEFEILQ